MTSETAAPAPGIAPEIAIVVHSQAHAVAALNAAAEAGKPVLLLSAVDAGLAAGAGWWREMIAAARDSLPGSSSGERTGALLAGALPSGALPPGALLDCGDDAGAAQGALRAGVEAIVFSGRADVAERLADIARCLGSCSGARVRLPRSIWATIFSHRPRCSAGAFWRSCAPRHRTRSGRKPWRRKPSGMMGWGENSYGNNAGTG